MLRYISLTVFLGAINAIVAAPEELVARNPLCGARNAYYPAEGNCDSYIECRDYAPSEMMCPDGLHFNPQAQWPEYPCGYPMDVPCARGLPQPAQATSECPHAYGFFPSPSADPAHCGQYRMCVEGKAVEMACPPGLAFNPDTSRCDWPDLVPACNAEKYLGFQCPPAPLDLDGEPQEVVNYPFPGSCYGFYSCEHGRPRLLTCDPGYSFDPSLGRCEEAEKVKCVS